MAMRAITALSSAAVVVACFAGAQAFGQFYYPDKKEYGSPKEHRLAYESVVFQSKDGTKLHGWFVPAVGNATGTIVHLHGNAQNLTAHFSFVAWLPKVGFNVFVFDYRGYGKSEGVPTRSGVYEDSVAAIRYVKSRGDIDQDRIVVFGQSLGGANAIAAVAQNEFEGIKAVVIEATFYSYRTIAKEKASAMGLGKKPGAAIVDALIDDSHSPGPVVDRISPIPLLFVHGTSDSVVPYNHSERLLDKAKEPKELWTIPGGRHTEAFTRYGSTYRPRLVAFLKKRLETDRNKSNHRLRTEGQGRR